MSVAVASVGSPSSDHGCVAADLEGSRGDSRVLGGHGDDALPFKGASRFPWGAKEERDAGIAESSSVPTRATAGDRSTAPSLSAAGRARQRANVAGWISRRTEITSVARRTRRVPAWQRAHPQYWKQRRGIKQRVLQDAWHAQVSDLPEKSVSVVLQDVCRAQAPVLIGLIAHLSDSLLQEDIATTSRRLLQRGRDLLGSRRATR
jgi:hypothetical protein